MKGPDSEIGVILGIGGKGNQLGSTHLFLGKLNIFWKALTCLPSARLTKP